MNNQDSGIVNHEDSKAFGTRLRVFFVENARKKIPYMKSAIVFFLLIMFIYISIEGLMIWPHFLATCFYLLFLECRKIVIKKNKKALELFIPFDIPFMAFFGVVAILTTAVCILSIRNYPVILFFSIAIFVISWGFKTPKLGDPGHLFRNVWIPLLMSVFLCFWCMGYMQKAAPDCKPMQNIACPSRWWVNLQPRRYFFTKTDETGYVYVIYPFNRYIDRLNYNSESLAVERLAIDAPGAYAVDNKRGFFYLGDSYRGVVKVLNQSDFSKEMEFNYKKYWPESDKPYACQIDYLEEIDKIAVYSCQKEISVFSASDYRHEITFSLDQPFLMKVLFPHYIFSALSNSDGEALVATWTGHVVKVNLENGKTLGIKWLGSPAQFIYPDVRNERIYVTTLSGVFFVLDRESLEILESIRVPAGVRYASVTPDGKTAFFKSYTSGKLIVYSLEKKKESDEVFVGKGNGWIEYKPETQEVFVSSSCGFFIFQYDGMGRIGRLAKEKRVCDSLGKEVSVQQNFLPPLPTNVFPLEKFSLKSVLFYLNDVANHLGRIFLQLKVILVFFVLSIFISLNFPHNKSRKDGT